MTDGIDSISGITSSAGTGASPYMQARKDAMDAVANQLGMSSSDMRSALVGGESLQQLAASKGISSTDLQNTIETALKKDLPNASSAQISKMASHMVSGPHGAHGGHHAEGASGSSGSAGADGSTDGNDLGGSVSLDL